MHKSGQRRLFEAPLAELELDYYLMVSIRQRPRLHESRCYSTVIGPRLGFLSSLHPTRMCGGRLSGARLRLKLRHLLIGPQVDTSHRS